MRGTEQLATRKAIAEPASEEVVTLIVVAMLTGIAVVLSDAATVATTLVSALV